MIKAYILNHDRKISFFVVYLIVGIMLALLLNLSILILFVMVHTIFDYHKYRLNKLSKKMAIGKAMQEQLMDLMFIFVSITLAVYLNHKTPGVVGLYTLKALEEIRIFNLVKALPRFLIIEHIIKGVTHGIHHIREHTTHISIPKFGDWEVFFVQMILYCWILIALAPAFTALTYADVWHNILIEVSPWHIGAH